MDAEELLRRYLEQRREMGETELVLDALSVEEALRMVGAKRKSSASRDAGELPQAVRPEAEPDDADWRAALIASDSASDEPGDGDAKSKARGGLARPRGAPPENQSTADLARADHRSAPPAIIPPPTQPLAAGIVVGGGGGELFGGPIGQLPTLDAIAEMVAGCTHCPLYKTATNPVPGEGSATARLMCIGEAPGANEDASGRPFVGQAGQLLTKILAAIDLKREDVFICNVLKHRPPGNRNPQPDEVEACTPYLVRQVELIRPQVIVAFGTFAAQTLLNTKLGIGKLRGATHRYHGIPVIVTYHPAALLRNPAWKRPTWEDVQLARRILDNTSA